MAFDPIQEDCHRLVLEALRRDNIPLTDGAAVERLMEQFTRNPAPLIVHDRDRAGHLIAKVVEAAPGRIVAEIGAVVEQPVEHLCRLARRSGDNCGMERRVAIRDVAVKGDSRLCPLVRIDCAGCLGAAVERKVLTV